MILKIKTQFFIRLASRGGKVNLILRCGWRPERAKRRFHTARDYPHTRRSGLPAVCYTQKRSNKSFIGQAGWLDIGQKLKC